MLKGEGLAPFASTAVAGTSATVPAAAAVAGTSAAVLAAVSSALLIASALLVGSACIVSALLFGPFCLFFAPFGRLAGAQVGL